MKRLWICVAFVAIIGNLASADDSDNQNSWYYDDWFDENFHSSEYAEYESEETDENVNNKSVQNLNTDTKLRTTESDKQYEFQDYQFEDNRSEVNDGNLEDVINDTHWDSKKGTKKPNEIEYLTSTEVDNLGIGLMLSPDKKKLNPHSSTKVYSNNQIIGLPTVTERDNFNFEKNIFEDTKSILNEDTENDFSQIVELNTEKTTTFTEILNETSRILDETLDAMELEDKNGAEEIDNDQELESNEDFLKRTTEDGTLNQAISDFRADLRKLQETWNKLNAFDDKVLESDEENKIFAMSINPPDNINKVTDDDNNIGAEKNLKTHEEVFPDDSQLTKEMSTSQPIIYLDDALPATDSEINKPVLHKTQNVPEAIVPSLTTQELILKDVLDNIQAQKYRNLASEAESSTVVPNEVTPTTQKSKDLSSSDDNDLAKIIASQDGMAKITPNDIQNANNVWLTVDSPTVITSPGYPNQYPTNSVTDWMISGDGMGIELNITDLAINGHVGDYLLFKPGGVDESGSTGLLFSYTLHSERRYRFLDVDRMFVRFETKPGPQLLRGFSFSVRMVDFNKIASVVETRSKQKILMLMMISSSTSATHKQMRAVLHIVERKHYGEFSSVQATSKIPRPGAPEPEPEPEPTIPEPPETITLNLGGVSLESFLQIEEQFRQIVAQMAATYITNNGIDPGVNTTLELTQIRNRALCFHNWPKFEQCVEVTFGVPLVYEDDEDEREPRLNAADLTTMWETYSRLNPFVEKLQALGITEYQVPNDRGIITVWLVIAGGVVISMAMLGFALWRFSCFEDYTRMPAFSDTDSIKEKRNLDLYPTPHQTLPPLYNESDYKWADAKYNNSTKVDVGGYSNRSYMREDPFDLESDEDIVPVSARNTSFSPRDIYSV